MPRPDPDSAAVVRFLTSCTPVGPSADWADPAWAVSPGAVVVDDGDGYALVTYSTDGDGYPADVATARRFGSSRELAEWIRSGCPIP